MKLEKNRIKIALPKKGRLRKPAIDLFHRAGYEFKADPFLLSSFCKNRPVEFVFLRTEDIPLLVERGIVNLGVTGSDRVMEKEVVLHKLLNLNYGHCRICLAGKGKKKYSSLKDLSGLKIATSFPNITKKYFRKNKIKIECIEMGGSIEVMVKLKISDMIADIVDTGETLKENDLSIWETIDYFSAMLYVKPKLKLDQRVIQIKKHLEGVLIAQDYSVLEYNINKEILSQAKRLTPGFDAPTITQLDQKDMVAIKVMIEKKKIPQVMDQLEELGASAIYETEIKNFRP